MACFCCGGSPPVGPSNAPIPAVGMAVGLELHTIPIANKPAAPARLPNTSDPAIAASAVMVVVRIRPSNTREQANKSTSVVIPSGPASVSARHVMARAEAAIQWHAFGLSVTGSGTSAIRAAICLTGYRCVRTNFCAADPV